MANTQRKVMLPLIKILIERGPRVFRDSKTQQMLTNMYVCPTKINRRVIRTTEWTVDELRTHRRVFNQQRDILLHYWLTMSNDARLPADARQKAAAAAARLDELNRELVAMGI